MTYTFGIGSPLAMLISVTTLSSWRYCSGVSCCGTSLAPLDRSTSLSPAK